MLICRGLHGLGKIFCDKQIAWPCFYVEKVHGTRITEKLESRLERIRTTFKDPLANEAFYIAMNLVLARPKDWQPLNLSISGDSSRSCSSRNVASSTDNTSKS